jgi:tetratricopeptide (TPR) repeat protein
MSEINENDYFKILELCQIGDNYAEQKKYNEAIEKYNEALDLIPDPFDIYKASTWILTAIGDAYFLMDDYKNACLNLQDAMYCPDAIGNPFIHLRLGQVQFELENLNKAKDELTRAYMSGGEEIFKYENSKYLEFLKTFLNNI